MSTKCKYGLRLITFTVGGGSSLQEFYGYIVPENLRKSQEMHGVEFILCTRTHVQSARILSFFLVRIFHIWAEYGDLRSKSSFSVQIREI